MAIKKSGAAGLKQILKRCSSLGRRQQQQHNHAGEEHWEEEEAAPSDVPRGHFAVYVGESRRRFVVPIAVLDRPEFRSLLRRAEEEFGFGGAGDLLVLPCEERTFRSLCSASSLTCTAR
ncbi:auxin-responsive protein SAUR50-like [Lolium rigidum]|uniref:auxin-responsive protein SAUR50-like n=1 Tax=Lolium rigidum TaxID=89674 RepID=UPI001F5D9128|nr:auxin-responsive protein SAUR50-like [Lolium rigidum]